MSKNTQKTTEWPRGGTFKKKDQARFHAGIASAHNRRCSGHGQLPASATQINCGDTSNLPWQTTETIDTTISNVGAVAPSGTGCFAEGNHDLRFPLCWSWWHRHRHRNVNVNTEVDASIRLIGESPLPQDWRQGPDAGYVHGNVEDLKRSGRDAQRQ